MRMVVSIIAAAMLSSLAFADGTMSKPSTAQPSEITINLPAQQLTGEGPYCKTAADCFPLQTCDDGVCKDVVY